LPVSVAVDVTEVVLVASVVAVVLVEEVEVAVRVPVIVDVNVMMPGITSNCVDALVEYPQ
jgi:ABC-type proline/glycine betaine transport system substrate-binding protein